MRIVHETNPRKYFPAVFSLAESRRIELVGSHRYSVFKEWLRSGIVDRAPVTARSRNALSDLIFRFHARFVRGETVILGFAPWSFRLLWYRGLAKHNRVIYHTSWHDWRDDSVPRRYGPLTPVMVRAWRRFLSAPSVRIVAVSEAARHGVQQFVEREVTVIPHAVPERFFEEAQEPDLLERPLRLIYVGELSRKKGLPQLLEMADNLVRQERPVELTLVGTGPLRSTVESAARSPHVSYLGPVADRDQLATVMSQHDVLVLLSRRQDDWEELFGIVIAEATAAGLGVIATDHVGPSHLLGDLSCGGLFGEEDVAGVENLISSLASHPAMRADYRRRHRSVATPYRVDVVAEAWARSIGIP
ncbi:glycosyltransferase [Microbacterium aquimaris]|uniref:glycosyltransferase family 4 protein n=1 Tax=Microbacterium aquimaris TaxID=459816 RepID=UPI002AD45588|nr:glycosyltransferase [Microbacterium aquimaris]MDZ8274542.1 glycosyltransferase [Microbacterium aquimaris]